MLLKLVGPPIKGTTILRNICNYLQSARLNVILE